MASEPLRKPTTAFAAVSPADAAIDPSAAFSLSWISKILAREVPEAIERSLARFYVLAETPTRNARHAQSGE